MSLRIHLSEPYVSAAGYPVRAFHREGVGFGWIEQREIVPAPKSKNTARGTYAQVLFEDVCLAIPNPDGDVVEDLETRSSLWSFSIEDEQSAMGLVRSGINYAVGERRRQLRIKAGKGSFRTDDPAARPVLDLPEYAFSFASI